MNSPETANLQALAEQLANMRAQYAKLPLPALMAESLLQRAQGEREPVAERLRLRAAEHLHQIEANMPAVANAPAEPGSQSPSALAKLTDRLNAAPLPQTTTALSPLDAKLAQQNQKLLGEAPAMPSEPEKTVAEGLRAAQRLQTRQRQQAKRQVVKVALERRPENPGPLNPQMLAVKILQEAQQASAGYLERLVSYMDALVMLDQMASKQLATKGKATKKK